MKRFLPYLSVLAAMMIWGGSGIAIKRALADFPPITLVTIRFTTGILLMLAVGLIVRRVQPKSGFALQAVSRTDFPLFLLAGFFQPFLYYILETYGYRAIGSPTIAEVLLSTSPLFAPLFAFLLLRERVTLMNLVGIVVSTGGVLLMVLAGNNTFSLGNPWGILLCFGAVFTAVMYTILLRKIPSRYNSLSIVFWVQLTSLLFFYPVWALTDGVGTVHTVLPDVTAGGWLSLAYLAALSSVAAFVCFCYSVRCIGVTRTNAFNNIRPVFTALFMLCLFGERLPWLKVVGIALVIAGLFICQYQKKKLSLRAQ
ncbi:MAG: DMT family transporter [Paludibacteraceae bacterium]|nr:DMT family transporter [Paludibacteraceae bacterium]